MNTNLINDLDTGQEINVNKSLPNSLMNFGLNPVDAKKHVFSSLTQSGNY